MSHCPVFWGSHGCDLKRDHDGQHWCTSCCYPKDKDHMALHAAAKATQYGADGCAGTWPYYGFDQMHGKTEHGLGFFLYEAPDWQFIYLPEEFARLAVLR